MEGIRRLYQGYDVALWIGLSLLVALIFAWLAALQGRLNRMLRDYRALMTGTEGGNLEEILRDHIAQVQRTTAKVDDLAQLSRQIESALGRSLQRVGMVRFNPFPDTGGDQSFAIALLDGHGDGIVISSLYGRTESRVYAKPVEGGESAYALSAEEREAIRRALQPAGLDSP